MKRTTRVKPDLYQVVTDRLITLLESGVAPWQRPWNHYGLASNYATGHTYTGINAFLLNFFPTASIPLYLTYKQAQNLGGQVRKGAKAETVYFFKTLYKDADGRTLKPAQVSQLSAANKTIEAIPMPRTFHLFNIADVEGIDFNLPELRSNPNTPIQQCDDFIASLHHVPEILHEDLDRAFYSIDFDRVNMPPLPRFQTSNAYYHVLFHELIHATGSAGRLQRPGITLPVEQRRAGSEVYVLEELTAELGAAYLCQLAGISSQPLEENTAAYLDSYLVHLRKNKKFLFKAASAAQQAVDYLLAPPD